MQSSPEARSGTAGRLGRRLLLLLALAACGGQEDAARTLSTTSGQECQPSPAVDPALLANGASWDSLRAWRMAAGVAFADSNRDSTTASVQLCDGCTPVTLLIVSEVRTFCNTPQSYLDSTRTTGVWVVLNGTVTPPGWNKTFHPTDSIFLFARDTSASAILAYDVNGRVQTAPDSAWNFRYCQDGGHGHNKPMGKWRQRRPTQSQGRDTVGEGETDPGTYGWMACASGCCQFYIPPDLGGIQIPDPARENAKGNLPDTIPPAPGPNCHGRP